MFEIKINTNNISVLFISNGSENTNFNRTDAIITVVVENNKLLVNFDFIGLFFVKLKNISDIS